jgi:hypothetical protein
MARLRLLFELMALSQKKGGADVIGLGLERDYGPDC